MILYFLEEQVIREILLLSRDFNFQGLGGTWWTGGIWEGNTTTGVWKWVSSGQPVGDFVWARGQPWNNLTFLSIFDHIFLSSNDDHNYEGCNFEYPISTSYSRLSICQLKV